MIHHDIKWNRFIIAKGGLKVIIFPDEPEKEPVDCTILGPGDCTDVSPDRWHTFEALEDVEGIEVYWTALDPSDITRRIQGGMRA